MLLHIGMVKVPDELEARSRIESKIRIRKMIKSKMKSRSRSPASKS